MTACTARPMCKSKHWLVTESLVCLHLHPPVPRYPKVSQGHSRMIRMQRPDPLSLGITGISPWASAHLHHSPPILSSNMHPFANVPSSCVCCCLCRDVTSRTCWLNTEWQLQALWMPNSCCGSSYPIIHAKIIFHGSKEIVAICRYGSFISKQAA